MSTRNGNYKKNRKKVLARDGFRCTWPGCTENRRILLSVHHVIPLSEGGSNSLDNLQTLCVLHQILIHNPHLAQLEAA